MTNEETTTEPIQQALDAFLVELLGEMPEVTHRWADIFGVTQNLLPLVGRLPGRDRVWSPPDTPATATCSASCAASSSLRPMLGGDDPLLELFSPSRLLPLEAS
jgi:hypothetical protein